MNGLTRAELIEIICPTDATYDCGQGNCSSSCDKCEDIINYLLDRYDTKVRTDAIDECKQILLDAIARDGKTKCHEYMVAVNEIEQLKEKQK